MLITIISIASSILTARILGPEGKGMYFLLYSTLNMILAIGTLKLTFSQVYFRKHLEFEQLIVLSIVLSLVMGGIAALLGSLVVYPIYDSIYKGVPPGYLVSILCLVPIALMSVNMRSLLDADYRIGQASIVMISRPALFLVLFSAMAILGWGTLGAAVLAMALSLVGKTLAGLGFVLRGVKVRIRNFDPKAARDVIGYAMRAHFGMMFRILQDRFDVFLVAYFLSPRDVGLYSVAIVVAEVAGRLSSVTSNVLLGRLAKAEDDMKSIWITIKLNRVVFFLTLISILMIAGLAGLIVEVAFGAEFSESSSATRLLLPGVLAVSVFRILNANLITTGRPGVFSIITILGVLIMVVGDVLMIPRMGIDGAAISATVTYIVTAILLVSVVVRSNSYPLSAYFDAGPRFYSLSEH